MSRRSFCLSRRIVFVFGFFVMSLSTALTSAYSQTVSADQQSITDEDLLKLSSENYDNWVKLRIGNKAHKSVDPRLLENTVLLRLREKKSVSDITIVRVLYYWTSSEEVAASELAKVNQRKAKANYPESKRYIETMAAALDRRKALQITLYQWYGYLSRLENDTPGQLKIFNKARQIRRPPGGSLSLDVWLVAGMAHWGDILVQQLQERQKADRIYSEVLAYPLPKFPRDEDFAQFRTFYLQVGRAVIRLRSDDIESLKETYFYSFAEPDLSLQLQTAIQALGGTFVKKTHFYPAGLEDILRQDESFR